MVQRPISFLSFFAFRALFLVILPRSHPLLFSVSPSIMTLSDTILLFFLIFFEVDGSHRMEQAFARLILPVRISRLKWIFIVGNHVQGLLLLLSEVLSKQSLTLLERWHWLERAMSK